MKRAVTCAVLAMVLAGSGCSTEVGGDASPASAVSSTASKSPLPAGLDVGEYSTSLYEPPQGEVGAAWIAEGNKMVVALSPLSDSDPALIEMVAGKDAVPAVQDVGSEVLPDGLSSSAFKAKVGVAVHRADRKDGPTKQAMVAVVRFDSAAEVASSLDTIQSLRNDLPGIRIADAYRGSAREVVPGTVEAAAAVGELMIVVQARAEDLGKSTGLASDLLAKQIGQFKHFEPAEAASITSQPLDRDGVLARSLGLSGNLPIREQRWIGLVTMPAMEARVGNEPSVPLMREAGVDLIGWNIGLVLRTRDEAAARRFAERTAAISTRRPAAGIEQLNDAVHCTQDDDGKSATCSTVVGRYYARVNGTSLKDAQQGAAAQWAILVQNP